MHFPTDAHQPCGNDDMPMRTSSSGVCAQMIEVIRCHYSRAHVLACLLPPPPLPFRSAGNGKRAGNTRGLSLPTPRRSRPSALLGPPATHPEEIRVATWTIAAVNNHPYEYWVTHPDPGQRLDETAVCALVWRRPRWAPCCGRPHADMVRTHSVQHADGGRPGLYR